MPVIDKKEFFLKRQAIQITNKIVESFIARNPDLWQEVEYDILFGGGMSAETADKIRQRMIAECNETIEKNK